MKRILFIILIVLLNFGFSYPQVNPQKISGVYQWCLVHCEVVKINEDFTFEYMFYKNLDKEHLLYKGILKGNWKVIGDNKIQLNGMDKKFKKSLQDNYEETGITIDPVYPPEIEFTFVVRKNKLQKLFNGNVEYTLKRVSKEESQKLFPEN